MAFSAKISDLIASDKTGLLAKHESWERVSLSDVATILNGAAFDSSLFSSSKGLPLIRIRDVLEGATSTFYDGEYESKYLVDHGDLLVGMDGDFHSGYWGHQTALLNQRVCKITTKSDFYDEKFLGYALPAYLSAINANTPSVTVKHLSSKTIGEILLPLPPKAEQGRIVEVLDRLISNLDSAAEELKSAHRKLEHYRRSLLKSAAEGTLTSKWRPTAIDLEPGSQLLERILLERRSFWERQQLSKFAESGRSPPKNWQSKYPEPVSVDHTNLPTVPDGWTWATVDQLTRIQRYGTSAKTGSCSDGVPVLRMGNIQSGNIILDSVKYLPSNHSEFPILFLEDGDLLFNRTNSPELVGKTAVYRSQIVPCSYASYLISVRLSELCVPEFVSAVINSSFGRSWISRVVTQQVGQANVNGTKLAALAVPLPPLIEQEKIVEVLMSLQRSASDQDAALSRGAYQIEAERSSILRAAFAGKLTFQDSNGESAGELLARIHEGRGKELRGGLSSRSGRKPKAAA